MVAGGRIKKDAQIDKADLIRIKIVLFVQLWHLRNGWHDAHKADLRSEERRVGKECRSRWSPYH